MSSYRYYVVGDCDMWAIQYAPAVAARAHVCVLDRAGCLRSKCRASDLQYSVTGDIND
jgi:hypothetical protein